LKKTGTFFLKRDNLQLGLLLGFVLPLLVLLLLYFIVWLPQGPHHLFWYLVPREQHCPFYVFRQHATRQNCERHFRRDVDLRAWHFTGQGVDIVFADR
jgi:hypothetical protein